MHLLRIFTLLLALIVALFSQVYFPQLLNPLDQTLNDWRTRFALRSAESVMELPVFWRTRISDALHLEGLLQAERRVIIVDINEASLQIMGAWPWSRATVANLLSLLIDEYGVAGVALDIVFPEQRAQDDLLATQFARNQVTGAVVYDLEQRGMPALNFALAPVPALSLPVNAPRMSGIPTSANHSGMTAARSGHITPLFDSDGSVRHLAPMICSPECRPLLGIAAFMGMLDLPHWKMQAGKNWLAPPWELQIFDHDNVVVSIPLDAEGRITVPYRHRQQDWVALSASSVLQKSSDPVFRQLLKGSLVLLGSTALGMADVIATPLNSVSAGLVPHAQVIAALFDQQFLVEPRAGLALLALFQLPFALLLFWGLRRFHTPYARTMLFPAWLSCIGG